MKAGFMRPNNIIHFTKKKEFKIIYPTN